MVRVDVFGIREEVPVGSCSCGGSCGPSDKKTTGEMYESLVLFSRKVMWRLEYS